MTHKSSEKVNLISINSHSIKHASHPHDYASSAEKMAFARPWTRSSFSPREESRWKKFCVRKLSPHNSLDEIQQQLFICYTFKSCRKLENNQKIKIHTMCLRSSFILFYAFQSIVKFAGIIHQIKERHGCVGEVSFSLQWELNGLAEEGVGNRVRCSDLSSLQKRLASYVSDVICMRKREKKPSAEPLTPPTLDVIRKTSFTNSYKRRKFRLLLRGEHIGKDLWGWENGE